MTKTRLKRRLAKSLRLWQRFSESSSGQIVVIFALALTAIVMGVGAGIDLSRAYVARQRLSQVATLTCQFSTRPSIVSTANTTYSGSNGFQTYLNNVNAFAASSLTSQHWSGTLPTAGTSGTGTNYFTATAPSGSGSTGTSPSNGITELSAVVPTTFMAIAHVTQLNVHAKVACNEAPTTPQIVNPGIALQEGFETSCVGFCFTNPSGGSGTISTPTSTLPATSSYTGATGTQLYVTGYCLEVDQTGVINATSPEGSHTAELDCDNGSGSAGNSSISSKVYLANGNYELRYFYRSRVSQLNFDPTYLCATTAADVSWVSPTTTTAGRAIRTNQINVYLDQVVTGSPPYHTTQDGTQQLAGTNLIDVCVYSTNWVERSVKIVVTTPAYYWLSFAADGANDSYGGQIDNIRVCQETCAGTPQNNFPTAWTPAVGGSVLLFEDSFQTTPIAIANTSYYTKTNAYLASVLSQTSMYQGGWPLQTLSPWATAPYNQMTYVTTGGSGGGQYLELDNCATTCSNGNRSISRPFLLDPGYYNVSYYYMSMMNFPSLTANYCNYPTSAGFTTWGTNPSANGSGRYHPTSPQVSANESTNILEVFMAHSTLVSTPIADPSSSTLTQTSYTNPNGTVSTTATYLPDAVNTSSYDSTQVNPMLDTCGYAPNYTFVPRSIDIKITKPGYYWLTFSANQSTADGYGAGVDDVKLSALGSPFMASPPVNSTTLPVVTIPVPAPQPDTVYNNSGAFNGFYIIADPFMPPAADQ